MNIIKENEKYIEALWEATSEIISNYVPEEDYTLDWEDFKKKHPLVSKEDYEMGVKRFQEM